MSLQDIKSIPSRYDEYNTSALEHLAEISEYLKSNPVSGLYSIVIKPNGDYRIWKSKTIGRLQQIGLLADIQHDLMSE